MEQRTPDYPPPTVLVAMNHGLVLVKEGRGGPGLRPETVDQARKLGKGNVPIDFQAARTLRAWYARFSVNQLFRKSVERHLKGAARVSWDLHGGDDGQEWAERAYEYLMPLGREK
jgi:hypothetical protein